jgi:hypothetical protein
MLSIPPALPGWGILYYASYFCSFIPVIGVGKLVISKSFATYLFALSSTILYGTPNPQYPYTTIPVAPISINSSFGGNIYWLGGILIWFAMTFTQRYGKKSPNAYDLFYYLVGIHLFYYGIASSLSLYTLTLQAALI